MDGLDGLDGLDERECRLGWLLAFGSFTESLLAGAGVEAESVAGLCRRAACNSGWDRCEMLLLLLRVLRDLGGEGEQL